MKNSFQVFFRLFFALSLIILGLKYLSDINRIEPFVSQTIDQIQHNVLKKQFNISRLKQYSQVLVYFEGFLFIASGLYALFRSRFTKLLIFIAVLVDLLLIHNMSLYKELKYKIYSSLLIGLLGGVYNVI